MSRCKSCSAPLPANSQRCDYCQTYNDVDLHGKYDYSDVEKESTRICPLCEINLKTVKIAPNQELYIEHCPECSGLFFDPGELEQLIEFSVSNVFGVKYQKLLEVNKERSRHKEKVRYLRCPECQNFMQRKNYAYKSGVVIDQCRSHGIWLDSGEATHLMEWYKLGGQLLHEKNESKRPHKQIKKTLDGFDLNNGSSRHNQDVISQVGEFITRLFR